MSTIFVHGVNTRRENSDYEANCRLTAGFLQQNLHGVTLEAGSINTAATGFPYWGDLATPPWEMKSLPKGEIDSLGAGVDPSLRPLLALIHDLLPNPSDAQQQPLLTLAHHRFDTSVDVLVDLALMEGGDPDAIAEFGVAAQVYAAAFRAPGPPPDWLAGCTTDEQFLAEFLSHAQPVADSAPQSLGLFSTVGNAIAAGAGKLKQAVSSAAGTVLDRAGDFASTNVLRFTRNTLNENLGRFFGDVFYYMDARGDKDNPGAIPQRILGEWDALLGAAPADEPLVIIGHSLGGVITYDLLSHFRPDIQVDLLVTVGSQVSHFQEINLFKDPVPPAGLSPRPANVRHWINIFDSVDIFAYACDRVFDGVQDFHYDTKTYVVKAHSAYFKQARFYERLRERVEQLS